MKVRMVTLAAGPDGVTPPGSEIDVADAVGVALCAAGYAVAVKGEGHTPPHMAQVEKAVDVAAVTASKRKRSAG